MKKLIGLVIASMIFANIGFAEVSLIESVTIKQKGLKALLGANFNVNTFCVDSYKFVMSKGAGENQSSRTMVQFFEERDGKSLPVKC